MDFGILGCSSKTEPEKGAIYRKTDTPIWAIQRGFGPARPEIASTGCTLSLIAENAGDPPHEHGHLRFAGAIDLLGSKGAMLEEGAL